MEKKPSSLKSRNTIRWTRRRLFKEALATGLSISGAMALTIDDVEASGDKFSIPVYVNQDEKVEVNADWHDQYIHSREVRNGVSSSLIGQTGIKSVGLDPGMEGGDNPHIVVGLDYDEYAGNIPERVSGVRIETEDQSDGWEEMADICSDYPREEPYPGGIAVDVFSTRCTNSSRFQTNSEKPYRYGWSVSGHCVPGCSEGEPADHNAVDVTYDWTGEKIGEEAFVDRKQDIAYIERDFGVGTRPEVVKPDSAWESEHIDGTFAERFLANQKGNTATGWGTSSCEREGEIARLHQDTKVEDNDCVDHKEDQVVINTGLFGVENGDSGTLWHMPYKDQTGAVGSLSSSFDGNFTTWAAATQGFSIANKHGMYWK